MLGQGFCRSSFQQEEREVPSVGTNQPGISEHVLSQAADEESRIQALECEHMLSVPFFMPANITFVMMACRQKQLITCMWTVCCAGWLREDERIAELQREPCTQGGQVDPAQSPELGEEHKTGQQEHPEAWVEEDDDSVASGFTGISRLAPSQADENGARKAHPAQQQPARSFFARPPILRSLLDRKKAGRRPMEIRLPDELPEHLSIKVWAS